MGEEMQLDWLWADNWWSWGTAHRHALFSFCVCLEFSRRKSVLKYLAEYQTVAMLVLFKEGLCYQSRPSKKEGREEKERRSKERKEKEKRKEKKRREKKVPATPAHCPKSLMVGRWGDLLLCEMKELIQQVIKSAEKQAMSVLDH